MNQHQSLSPLQGQQIAQEQKLMPQQMLSLDILSIPLMDLENRINEELIQNPILEIADGQTDYSNDSADEYEDPANTLPQESSHAGELQDKFEQMQQDDDSATWTEFLQNYADWADIPDLPQNSDSNSINERRDYLFNSVAAEPSLQDMLENQLSLSDISRHSMPVAEEIIGNLNNSGYLAVPLSEIAARHHIPVEEAEKILKQVQQFDPPGIAARTLEECLLLQLERSGRKDPLLTLLIQHYLPQIAKNKLPVLAKELNITFDELNTALQELRKLNPCPAAAFDESQPEYILPEVTVIPDDGEFKIQTNQDACPQLILSQHYLKMLEDPSTGEETKAYIRQKVNYGKMLMHSLNQRSATILRIAELITAKQHDFMLKGPEALQPMTMQELADKMGFHEATISRAVAGKYMQTPVGLFRFKDFFTSGFRSDSGSEVSSQGIKERIRELIDREDAAKPYSDSKLVDLLKQQGLDVARRTVAKYREELGIPSSSLRRVY